MAEDKNTWLSPYVDMNEYEKKHGVIAGMDEGSAKEINTALCCGCDAWKVIWPLADFLNQPRPSKCASCLIGCGWWPCIPTCFFESPYKWGQMMAQQEYNFEEGNCVGCCKSYWCPQVYVQQMIREVYLRGDTLEWKWSPGYEGDADDGQPGDQSIADKPKQKAMSKKCDAMLLPGKCGDPSKISYKCDACGVHLGTYDICEVQLVPGLDTHNNLVLGYSSKVFGLDQVCEDTLPERARFCKNGMHFHFGDSMYMYCGTQFAGSGTNNDWTQKWISAYRKYDPKNPKSDLIEFEDFIRSTDVTVQDGGCLCCKKYMTTHTELYYMRVRKNGKQIGGITFHPEGYRMKGIERLDGLVGQQSGPAHEFAYMYAGDEKDSLKVGSYLDDGMRVKREDGLYDEDGEQMEPSEPGCCKPKGGSGSKNKKKVGCCGGLCDDVGTPGVKYRGEVPTMAHDCRHKSGSTWMAKIPDKEGDGLLAAFWQVKAQPAQSPCQYMRSVSIMAPDEQTALLSMMVLPHPHTENPSFYWALGNRRERLMPEVRDDYGLGWSQSYIVHWDCTPHDAIQPTGKEPEILAVTEHTKFLLDGELGPMKAESDRLAAIEEERRKAEEERLAAEKKEAARKKKEEEERLEEKKTAIRLEEMRIKAGNIGTFSMGTMGKLPGVPEQVQGGGARMARIARQASQLPHHAE